MAFPISWTDLTSDSSPRSRPLAARGGDVYLIIHHAYNLTVQQSLALSKPGGREVSMTFAIGPSVAGAASPIHCVYVVPIDRRPWTTASSLDDAAVTAEVSNLDLASPYPVALEAKTLLALIAAEMHREFGMPLDRVHVLSHQEVYARGLGSYATACPGPDLQAALDWIVAKAQEFINPPPKKENTGMDINYLFWPGDAAHPREYALAAPTLIEGGVKRTTSTAEAEAFSIMMWGQNQIGAPYSCKTWAQYEATLALAAELAAGYKKLAGGTVNIGDVSFPKTFELGAASLAALARVEAAVNRLNPPG